MAANRGVGIGHWWCRALPWLSLGVAATILLGGCAGYQAYRDGQADLVNGRVEPALGKLKQAMDESPHNVEFRTTYFTQREAMVTGLIRKAQVAVEAGEFASAREAYAQALRLDPGSVRAATGTTRLAAAEQHWSRLDAASALARQGDLDAALAKTQEVLSDHPTHVRAQSMLRALTRQRADRSGKELGLYPKLKASYRTPVSLSFANATLQQAFDAMKQASGLNYMFDRDVRTDARVSLSVTSKPVEDVIRLLLATHQLERRVLDEDTLLIYPNTPAKAAEYREMVVRTFALSHADATKLAGTVKAITKARDVVVDEKLNQLVVRDSAEVIRLVEKLIATQDLADPEVMLELEVLEISANRLIDMGINWPAAVSASVVGSAGVAGQLKLDELRERSSSLVKVNLGDPLIAAQLRSEVGGAQLLANPRVRVRNKQVAKILIGERVPVFTTTAAANVGTFESVSYLDVGLKLEIEPTVSLDDEVSMKLALEVSNILERIARASGTQAYRLGTRNTSTTLRVRDGETNVLAGLIQRDERRSNMGVPGANEIPILGRLFGASHDNDSRTEIVLLITPRIVRNIEFPGLGLHEFLAGTDASVGAPPIQLGAPGGRAGSTSVVAPAAYPAGPSPSQTTAPAVAPGSSIPAPRPPIPQAPPGANFNRPPAAPSPGLVAPPLVPTSPSAPSTPASAPN